jgi:uncharacterized protein (DUF2267 family)
MIDSSSEHETKGEPPVQSNNSSAATVGAPTQRRRHARTRPRRIWRISAAHVVWSGILRILQRVVHHKKSDRREFKLNFSVRDVLADSSRAVKAQFEALVQAVQKAGKYPAREEAARAVHAVMDALKDKVPPDVLSRVAESLHISEAARRLHLEGKTGPESEASTQSLPAAQEPVADSVPTKK